MVKATLCVLYWLAVFMMNVYMKHGPHPKPFKYWEVPATQLRAGCMQVNPNYRDSIFPSFQQFSSKSEREVTSARSLFIEAVFIPNVMGRQLCSPRSGTVLPHHQLPKTGGERSAFSLYPADSLTFLLPRQQG